MKADERHKLKTNELADYLTHFTDKVRKHSRLLIALAAVLVGAVAVTLFVGYQRSVKLEQAWNELNAATGDMNNALARRDANQLSQAAERFGQVAAAYPDEPPVTALACYYQGHALLVQASQKGMVNNRSGYLDLLARAEEAFKKVLEQPYHGVAHPAARMELAAIDLDRGDFAQARDLYRQVADDVKAAGEVRELARFEQLSLPSQPQEVVFAAAPPTPPPSTSAEVEIPGIPRLQGPPDLAESLKLPPRPKAPPPTIPASPGGANSGEPGRQAGPTTQPRFPGE